MKYYIAYPYIHVHRHGRYTSLNALEEYREMPQRMGILTPDGNSFGYAYYKGIDAAGLMLTIKEAGDDGRPAVSRVLLAMPRSSAEWLMEKPARIKAAAAYMMTLTKAKKLSAVDLAEAIGDELEDLGEAEQALTTAIENVAVANAWACPTCLVTEHHDIDQVLASLAQIPLPMRLEFSFSVVECEGFNPDGVQLVATKTPQAIITRPMTHRLAMQQAVTLHQFSSRERALDQAVREELEKVAVDAQDYIKSVLEAYHSIAKRQPTKAKPAAAAASKKAAWHRRLLCLAIAVLCFVGWTLIGVSGVCSGTAVVIRIGSLQSALEGLLLFVAGLCLGCFLSKNYT